jgi:Ca-activated chloride channel homolog
MIIMNRHRVRSLGSRSASRCGGVAVLIAVMMGVFVVTAAITIDYAYMQLVRTELRIATDAAAKAGAEALGRLETPAGARQAATDYASRNLVGGRGLGLNSGDIQLGRLVESGQGRYGFGLGQSPFNAVNVTAGTGPGTAHPAVGLFFGRVLGVENFTPLQRATAGQQRVDVVLCLDRSHSMCWDMSGRLWTYPPNGSGFTSALYRAPPDPVLSRWAQLVTAVNVFLQEAAPSNPPPRIGLVTWASTAYEPQAATVDVALPTAGFDDFAANRQAVVSAMHERTTRNMNGATNLSAGLDLAVAQLTRPGVSQLSDKVVLLMTDGEWNEGRNPRLAAQDARNRGIIVHTVTMLTGSQPDVEAVAAITGGRSFNTTNSGQLIEAFREIARSIQTVLVD